MEPGPVLPPPAVSTLRAAPWRSHLLFCLVLVLLVLPFVDKPPHIDEESYLFIGHALQAHWLKPYHWWRAWQPTWSPAEHSYLYAHPPLFLWWSALTEWLCGPSEVLRRLSALPFVLGLGLGLAGITRAILPRSSPSHADPERSRWQVRLWALWILSAPCLLLIQHQSLMPDLPWVCFIVLACFRGLTAPRAGAGVWWPHLQAGLLMGLAAWIKYPALVFLPLGFAFPGATRKSALAFISGALLVVLPGELWLTSVYGTPHLLYVLRTSPQIEHTGPLARALGMLAQLGMCALGPLVLVRFWSRDAGRAAKTALLSAFLGGTCWWLARHASENTTETGFWSVWAELMPSFPPPEPTWVLAVLLAFALGGALLSSMRLRTSEDRFLTVWALLGLSAVLLGHNFSSTRYLGPAVVPLGLLVARAWLRGQAPGGVSGWRTQAEQVLWGVGLALSLLLAQADRALAQVYPTLGAQVALEVERLRSTGSVVWFRGEWGFRAELEARGYQALPPGVWPAPGDVLVWAELAGSGRFLPELRLEREVHLEAPQAGLRVMWPGRAGYYASVLGMLPFSWYPGPLERVGLGRVPVRHESSPLVPGEGGAH